MRHSRLTEKACIRLLKDVPGVTFYSGTFNEHAFHPHSHDALCLIAVTSGCAIIQVGEDHHALHGDDTAVILPGVVHSGRSATSWGTHSYCSLHIEAEHIDRYGLKSAVLGYSRVDQPVRRDPEYAAALVQTVETALGRETANEVCQAIVGHVSTATTRMRNEAQSRVTDRIVRKVSAFLKTGVDRRVTMDELARAAGISKFHLIRVFKKQTGLTPWQYLRQLRIERACGYLRQGEAAAAVAAACGFADQAHFIRNFKGHFGVTPRHFARS